MGKTKDKGADINELKQEVKMDEHIIPLEELATRYGSNIETVSSSHFFAQHDEVPRFLATL